MADTELPGHPLLGHADPQAKILEPVPEKVVDIRTPVPAHMRRSFLIRAV
jgi:hypothetical protein